MQLTISGKKLVKIILYFQHFNPVCIPSCLCLTWSGYPSNDDDDDEQFKLLLRFNPNFGQFNC